MFDYNTTMDMFICPPNQIFESCNVCMYFSPFISLLFGRCDLTNVLAKLCIDPWNVLCY